MMRAIPAVVATVISLTLVLTVAPVRSFAQAAAGAGLEPPPGVDQLKQLLSEQKYQDVIRGVAKCLALRGPAAQNYDRYELYMLRGEAFVHTKGMPMAAESFAAAQKETQDQAKKDAARAMELLVRRSKPTGYTAKTSTTRPAPTFPIVNDTDRPAAFAALFTDEMAVARPRIKAATNATNLNPIIDVARSLGDMHALEQAASNSAAQTKEIGSALGEHAHKLIADALTKMGNHVEEIWKAASKINNYGVTDRYGRSIGGYNTSMMGLTSVETGDLKNTIATCEKVVPVATDLATVTGGSDLTADAKEAQRVHDRAKEVLEYDYSGGGVNTSTSTGTGTRLPPITPPTPPGQTPRTPYGR